MRFTQNHLWRLFHYIIPKNKSQSVASSEQLMSHDSSSKPSEPQARPLLYVCPVAEAAPINPFLDQKKNSTADCETSCESGGSSVIAGFENTNEPVIESAMLMKRARHSPSEKKHSQKNRSYKEKEVWRRVMYCGVAVFVVLLLLVASSFTLSLIAYLRSHRTAVRQRGHYYF